MAAATKKFRRAGFWKQNRVSGAVGAGSEFGKVPRHVGELRVTETQPKLVPRAILQHFSAQYELKPAVPDPEPVKSGAWGPPSKAESLLTVWERFWNC